MSAAPKVSQASNLMIFTKDYEVYYDKQIKMYWFKKKKNQGLQI